MSTQVSNSDIGACYFNSHRNHNHQRKPGFFNEEQSFPFHKNDHHKPGYLDVNPKYDLPKEVWEKYQKEQQDEKTKENKQESDKIKNAFKYGLFGSVIGGLLIGQIGTILGSIFGAIKGGNKEDSSDSENFPIEYSIRNIGGKTDIVKNDDGTYTVTTQYSTYGSEPKTKIISEEEFQEQYAKFVDEA